MYPTWHLIAKGSSNRHKHVQNLLWTTTGSAQWAFCWVAGGCSAYQKHARRRGDHSVDLMPQTYESWCCCSNHLDLAGPKMTPCFRHIVQSLSDLGIHMNGGHLPIASGNERRQV